MTAIVVLFTLMLVLILLGVPLVYSIGVASGVLLLSHDDLNVTLLAARMFKGVDSFVLTAIPFFLLAAELLSQGGLTQRIIELTRLLLGHLRGALAQVNIAVSMIFAGIQASCTADSAAIGGVMIPAMIRERYDKDLSVVVTATSSCIGPIIPPSILMILYAFLTNTSVARLFLGGAIPGLLLGVALMGLTHYWVRRRGYPRGQERMGSIREIARKGVTTSPALLVPLIIVGGLVGGVVTPTEAGVLACLAAFLVSGLCYRELSAQAIVMAFKKAAQTTATIWAVIAVSTVFSEICVRYQLTRHLVSFLGVFGSEPFVILLVMTTMVFVLGMAIDTTPLLIMLAKPLHDAAMLVGVDPVHLGVVLVMTALMGTVSPPVALLLCLNCGIAQMPLRGTFGLIWSYLAVMLGVVLLCILVPELVTWLPDRFL